MRSLVLALVLLFTAFTLWACGKNEAPPPPSTGVNITQETGPGKRGPSHTPGDQAGEASDAQRIFMTVCATCHGIDGTGTGPAAESLNPKPRNYTDAQWQASVTDDDIREIIVKGGQAMKKSAMMPANPNLKDDRATLDGLVQIIRGFAQKP
jgi:cytochrome c553